MNPKVRLPARPVAGMTLVLMRFIHHVEGLRRESGRNLGDHWVFQHGP